MTTLLVGFDSAWTHPKQGALVGVLRTEDGSYQELDLPQMASFLQAEEIVRAWHCQLRPRETFILLDQPIIVKNPQGQRPVEHLVSTPICRRRGGVQPANTGKVKMFGLEAPVWKFLRTFGGAADPTNRNASRVNVFETYPALALIGLTWLMPDRQRRNRLPKYNPERSSFSLTCWQHVCERTATEFKDRGLWRSSRWLEEIASLPAPSKSDQDRLDACICLLVALHLAECRECLMVGNLEDGYMVVPYGEELHQELVARWSSLKKARLDFVRRFQLFETREAQL